MEKTCGPLPYWMASNAKDEFKQCFDLKRSEETIQTRKMRLKWPEAAKKKDSYNNWLDQKTLDVSALVKADRLFQEIIMHESSSDHKAFKEFLEFMFQQDPKKRPSANECSKHPFFQLQIKDETKRVENEAAEQGFRQESKSTEKTRGSTSHYSPQSCSNTNTNF